MATTPGADASWWQVVSAGLEREEYRATVSDEGLQAPNRAQNLRTRFGSEGIAVEPRLRGDRSPWQFAWKTTGFGRPGHMVEADPAVPECHGARVTYARPGLCEWYENTPEGIEQGFTLDQRPPGAGPLRIAGALAAELTPELHDGEVDFFAAGGARVLHYGKLVTRDANGHEVPSRLELAAGELIIEVDDHGAAYPLTIDPLMTSPAWMADSDQAGADFGYSVVTAGDVNRDGFSDVLVGAPGYANGQINEGRAFLFLGSAAGLSGTPAWTKEGDSTGALFARALAPAGDVNGDGYGDVIIGAMGFNGNRGRARVYHGSAAGLGASPAWTVNGNQTSAYFAASVSTAGDVNGDGFSDVLVGAPEYSNGQGGEGRGYLYLGSASGLATNPAWIAEGNQSIANFGSQVASAGDVNGDGYADVVIGSPFYPGTAGQVGGAFVYHGSAAGLSATPAWTGQSDHSLSLYGRSVAGAGDLNGDGYADIVVGAPAYSNPEPSEGRAYLYYGSSLGIAWVQILEGNQIGAEFGYAVATAGDVDGDGYADVMIAARSYDNGEEDEGRAFVYRGSVVVSTTPLWTAETNQDAAAGSIAIGAAGDVNGDGFSDVVFGANDFDNGELNEGAAFVYHGGADGPASLPMFWTTGGQTGAAWGWAVGSAGDVNGDGYSDVYAVASTFDNGQGDEGKVWVYHGSSTGIPVTSAWSAETNQIGAEIASAASAGDVNGDGYSDFLYGSYRYDGLGGSNCGHAVLHLGSATGLDPAPVWSADGDQASAWLGGAVGGVGDVNGDGYADYLIGADGYDNDQANEGRAWLYMGSVSALGLPGWNVEGGQDGASLGYSVGAAGDVNRDGFADVLIGVPGLDHGEVDEGAVWVFYGTTGGLSTTPGRVLEANQAGASFGGRVSTAGDVNGDGYSDVIIGADHYDGGQVDEGKAFLYYGGNSGIPTTPAWTFESDQPSAWLGKSAGTAGDVNGDGYSDLVLGAPLYDDGETDEGRVWIFHGSPAGPGPSVLNTYGDQPGALYGYSVGTAGDVNGDGFSDAIAGAPGYDFSFVDTGLVLVMPGNKGDGLHRTRQQMRVNELVPIDSGGRSDSQSSFRVQALARTPAGRGKVRIQIEAKPLGTPFDGSGLVTTSFVQTSLPGPEGSTVPVLQSVSGLAPGRIYRWRVRMASDSPFFPRSPWLWPPANAATEGDVRTAGTPVGVMEDAPPKAAAIELGPAVPNPFTQMTEVAFTLPRPAAARLGVYDVQGRLVARLADGPHPYGSHRTRWDGRDASGHRLPAGIYFFRLELEGRIATRKVVMSR